MAKAQAQAATPKKSLADYVKEKRAEKKKAACWLCSIPEAAEVSKARAAKVQIPEIIEWLKLIGYADATKGKVRNHFESRHDEA